MKEIKCPECGTTINLDSLKAEEKNVYKFELDIGISMNVEEFLKLSSELEEDIKELGFVCMGAGAGFGYRDMQFEFQGDTSDIDQAKRAKAYAIEWLTKKLGEPGTGEDKLWYVTLIEFSTQHI